MFARRLVFSGVMAVVMVGLLSGCPIVTPSDPCDGVTCDDGFTCDPDTGSCVAEPDPCDDVTCDDDETCVDGECVPLSDPCDGVSCAANETCVDGVCVEDMVPEPRTYVGTDTCLTCHGATAITGTDMSSFLNSGHPYKLNKVVDGAMPDDYPFTTLEGVLERVGDDDADTDDGATVDPNLGGTDNTLGTPGSFADVTYVIGGFGWKARFIDANGYIVTGSNVQYNFETDTLSGYHDNETDKPYNCGNCHTTGWKAYTSEEGDDRNLNRQDDLPGMSGTFFAPGVHCEACHGAGSAHVASASADDITREATPRTTEQFLADDMAYGAAVACSDCHTRDGEKDYPTYVGGVGLIKASGSLIRHHEQYDEMIGIDPDDPEGGMTGPHSGQKCIACHNPHATTKHQDVSGDAAGMDTACTDCHGVDGIGGKDYALTGGMVDLACIDCHMPKLVKNAVSFEGVGGGPTTGDIKSHIFRIDLSAEAQFTEDGAYAYPAITGDYACKKCHNDSDEGPFNINFPSGITIHN